METIAPIRNVMLWRKKLKRDFWLKGIEGKMCNFEI